MLADNINTEFRGYMNLISRCMLFCLPIKNNRVFATKKRSQHKDTG